jgi:branched-chain amino acid transport system substrate-binding protein
VKEWVLPTLAVQTGPLAFAGVPFHWAADYVAKEINDAGGIRGVPLKLVHYDSAYPDMAKTAAAAAKAIPGALLINGPMMYPETAAMAQLIIDAKIAHINAADDPVLIKLMAPYGLAQLQCAAQGHLLAGLKWLKLNPGIKTVAVFYAADEPQFTETVKILVPAYEKVGVKVVPCEIIATDQTDMGALALKALRAKADGFHSLLLDFQTAGLAKELYNRGMTNGAAILSGYPSNGPALFALGEGFIENSYVWDNYNIIDTSPGYKRFFDAYAKAFSGQYPGTSVISAMDGIYAFKTAVETLGITGDPARLAEERKKIVDFLYNSPDLPGGGGIYKYRYVNGEKIAPRVLFQVKNNRFVYVDTIPVQ